MTTANQPAVPADVDVQELVMHSILPNGSMLRRSTDKRRIFRFAPDGTFVGEVLAGSFEAQLLGLNSHDFGEGSTESDPRFVVGSPPAPVRTKTERRSFAAAVREIRRRLFGR
jgi:hypothetical protein